MTTKIQSTLVAAFVLASASVALAQNAPAPVYQGQAAQDQTSPRALQNQNRLIEGRNVGVGGSGNIYQVPAEQRIWLDRTATDFNS